MPRRSASSRSRQAGELVAGREPLDAARRIGEPLGKVGVDRVGGRRDPLRAAPDHVDRRVARDRRHPGDRRRDRRDRNRRRAARCGHRLPARHPPQQTSLRKIRRTLAMSFAAVRSNRLAKAPRSPVGDRSHQRNQFFLRPAAHRHARMPEPVRSVTPVTRAQLPSHRCCDDIARRQAVRDAVHGSDCDNVGLSSAKACRGCDVMQCTYDNAWQPQFIRDGQVQLLRCNRYMSR